MRHASLNRIYRLIWSPVQQAWVIASEHAKGRSKTNNRQLQKLLAITVLATGSSAWAAPSGGQVTAGSGSISSSGNTTTVTQSSQNLSLNWQSFNTSKQEVVNFIQPSASAIAVNRISDPNPTQFFGQLNANGQVFLINPNGVLFGAGSQINVGGLVASTLDISDAGLNNLNRQFSGSATGSIINQGSIHASDGGYIAFVGNTVSNQGSLSAPMGVVALAAGSDATLTFADNHLVKMQVNRNTLQNLAENGGLIQADGGAVLLSAGAKDAVLASVVNNTGIIEARSVQNLNGSIILDGGNLGSTSQSGRLDVTGKQAGETGGTVKVLGGQVSLGAGSTIDASGDAGGGTVLVGGNFHGAGSEQNAQSTTIAAGTTINADAINSGDGGKVAVWSDGRTQFNGSITARGGANAGNGGQVETSGQTLLIDSTAAVNTAAPKGSAGNWLLDPDDITIGNLSAWGSGYGINVDTSVLTAALNNGNVTIKTTASSGNCTGVSCSASGGGNGDIIILDTIGSGYNYAGTTPTTSYNWVTGSTLTLSAYRNIRFKLTSNVAWNSGGDVGGGVSIDAGGHLVLKADNSSKGTGTVTFDDSTGMTAVYFSSGSGSTTIFYNPITLNSPTDYSPYVFTQSTSQLVAYMAVNLSATIADKIYDGTTNASLSNVSATLPTGITLNTSAQAASFSDKNVGSNKTVSLSGIGFNGGGTMSAPDGQSYRTISYGGNDYYLNGLSTQTANITPKSVNVTGLAANNKTYDGSTSATLAGSASLAASDVINGDVLTLSGTGVGTFANANAGSNKTVTVTGYSLAGTDAGNYSFVAPAGLTATINKADLTLSGSKTYDATTSVTGSLLTASGVNGQTFSVTGTGDTSNLSSKNVQTNATLNSVTGLALGTSSNGGLSSNYNALSTTGSAITVTAKTLTLSGITASDKVYDGTSTATLNTSSVGYAGLINGDTVSLNGSASASFADKNAGSNKAVSVSGYTLSGSDAGNYTVVQPTGLTANINKANLNVSGVTASDKTYDGSASASLSGTAAVSAIGSDVVSVSGTGVGSFADKNAGSNKAVSVSGYTLSGSDAGNYTVVQPTGLTANINKANLNVSGVTASDKTYDGSASASLSGTAAVSAIGSDVVSVSGTGVGSFADKNAGSNKAVSVSGYTLSGSDAGNYTVVQPTGLTANINKANLNVSGVTASDKTYDGSSSASLSGTAAVSAIGSDVVSVSGTGVGSFADKNAGSNKSVSVSGYTLSGSDAGNYTVVQPTGLTANINKANLNVSGVTASDKTYDGSASASLSGTAAVSAIGSDVVSVSGTGVGSFADKNAGSNKSVSVSGYTLSGSDAGNYTVVQPTGLTANILQAQVTVSGITANNKTFDGGTAASVVTSGAVLSGKLSTDQVTISATGTFADAAVGTGKTVNLVSSYGGSDAGNYLFTSQASTQADITPAPVLPSNPATPSSLVTQQIQNTVTQVQSSMLPPQAASQPQALNLSSTLTIKQESGTDPGQSSANDKTKGNAANGLVTSTVAIGSGGPVLQILNGGTQLSDNAARITE